MARQGDRFEVKEDHLKLLRRMYVGWQNCEYGAPEIDPKRPYGNSSVGHDIAEILGWKYPDEDLLTPEEYDEQSEAVEAAASRIHREMEMVLQILVNNTWIGVGQYVATDYARWKPLGT